MKIFWKLGSVAVVAVMTSALSAEVMDRPVGIKIGERLTLKPYLSFSAAYDSNVDGRSDGREDIVWVANPGLGIEYKAETWMIKANAFYQFNAYSKHNSENVNNYHAYGEDLTYNWTDSLPGERGWSLMLMEKYMNINQIDDIVNSSGTEYGRDRQEFKMAGALQRRFGGGFHADLNCSYYWLDYENDDNTSYSMYGWNRWLVGLELGYAPSKWTDILIAGSYQGYQQDNTQNTSYSDFSRSNSSEGWTIQGGIGSFATERITYRLLGGVSTFRYAESDADTLNGFTYTVSGNWKISDTWNTMLLATSYYQPSETSYSSATRVDSVSWGLAHSMVRGKLRATFDAAYRREGREYSGTTDYDYDLDIMSFRLGLYYTLNRYLELFTNFEFRQSMVSGQSSSSSRGDMYDYDRFRAQLGVRFTY